MSWTLEHSAEAGELLPSLCLCVQVTQSDLLAVPEGPRTEATLRTNCIVGVQYLEAWLGGMGCVPIDNLMEDAATAEICRTQVGLVLPILPGIRVVHKHIGSCDQAWMGAWAACASTPEGRDAATAEICRDLPRSAEIRHRCLCLPPARWQDAVLLAALQTLVVESGGHVPYKHKLAACAATT